MWPSIANSQLCKRIKHLDTVYFIQWKRLTLFLPSTYFTNGLTIHFSPRGTADADTQIPLYLEPRAAFSFKVLSFTPGVGETFACHSSPAARNSASAFRTHSAGSIQLHTHTPLPVDSNCMVSVLSCLPTTPTAFLVFLSSLFCLV